MSIFDDLRPTFTLRDMPGWPFGWLMYFHLEGGVDEKRNDQHLWTAFYDCPADGHAETRGLTSAIPYCQQHGYPCGVGETPEEAIENLKQVLPRWIESRTVV
jgi:hypothetical protein